MALALIHRSPRSLGDNCPTRGDACPALSGSNKVINMPAVITELAEPPTGLGSFRPNLQTAANIGFAMDSDPVSGETGLWSSLRCFRSGQPERKCGRHDSCPNPAHNTLLPYHFLLL